MSQPGSGLPDLCRICVLQDARAKATFSDNTILITNSTGSAFLITTPDGKSTRQVSEYALTRHSPLLAAVLEFRNMHMELPCFCKPLARVLRSSFTLGYVIRDATWPTPAQAIAEGLTQLQSDGKVVLSSEDGVAQVVLHSHQRRFAVCYPLLVMERPQEAKYEYIWQTQVFSVASHPARWQPAVIAAHLVAAQLGQTVNSSPPAAPGQQLVPGPQGPDPTVPLEPDAAGQTFQPDPDHGTSRLLCAGGGAGAAGNPGAPLERRSVLPRAEDCVRSAIAEQLRSDGWWGEPSLSLLPPDDALAFEWTPHATYQFLEEAGEVEVWVHADESCMVSTRGGKFLEHFKGAESSPQLYAASCVPDAVWSRDQACRYPLASLAAHALKVRSHNATLTAALAARAPAETAPDALAFPGCARGRRRMAVGSIGDDLFAVVSTNAIEASSVPGHGQFTAYEDGRVRVRFEDRTILHMSASQSHCKVVLPDGSAVVVASANPVGVEAYVEAAREFAHWAFKTPEERAQELRVQARVRAELLNSQRMAQMCEYTATGALPPALAQSDAVRGLCASPDAVPDRQTMIEKLLSENARLLQRL